jgi:hypothetical protein
MRSNKTLTDALAHEASMRRPLTRSDSDFVEHDSAPRRTQGCNTIDLALPGPSGSFSLM